jgi:hypothetical protein
MRWQLFIEEYSPDLRYTKGENNIVAGALSRLNITHEAMGKAHFTEELRSSLYCYTQEDLPPDAYPLSYLAIGTAQAKGKQMLKKLQLKDSPYKLQSFHGGGKSRELICYKVKIVIPATLQIRFVDWYHNYLGHPGIPGHPGINRTEETIGQRLWWPNMRTHIALSVSTCANFQRNKR